MDPALPERDLAPAATGPGAVGVRGESRRDLPGHEHSGARCESVACDAGRLHESFPKRPAHVVDWAAAAERYADVVYSVTIKFGLSPHDAAEAFQDTWVVALSKERVPEEPGMVPWLVAIACWRCRTVLRRRRTGPLDDGAAEAVLDEDAPPPEDVLAAAEEEQVVRDAFRSLPDRDRELLSALYLAQDPLPYVDVARRLGVAVGSIGMLRQRALGRLRGALDRSAPGLRRTAVQRPWRSRRFARGAPVPGRPAG